MIGEKRMRDKLTAEFAENYLEKLFYFCLKRTGGVQEAEDLASDISLNILAALNRGTVPASFSAWVWQIARNRYSVWADARRRYRESTAGVDIGDCELVSEETSAEERLIRGEELALLRRELSFVSSDYRNIVVAYYIEDKKVQDIAASAGLPEGTVKSKLFRARKKLKEGMSMAREFGTKSFQPENVSFLASGEQPSGLPWSRLGRKLPKNILLEASNNPSTAEELSVELGTALPYMEEEIELLVKATLLKKADDKYLTDFYIFDRETQWAIYTAQRRESKKRSGLIGTVAFDSLGLLRSLGVAGGHMSDNDLLWWAAIALVDHCIVCTKDYQGEWPAVRANGETWGIVGLEQADLPENCSMSHDGIGDEKSMFWMYRPNDKACRLWNRRRMTYAEALFLGDVIRNGRNRASFSDSERKIWGEMENVFAHADGGGNIIPDILVLYSDVMEQINEFWEKHPLYGELMEYFESIQREIVGILKKDANPLLHDQLFYCASSQMFNCRMMAVHDLVEEGRLALPEEPGSSRAAMWMWLAAEAEE